MPRFAANLTYLFKELPLLDRFAAAADAGFDGVEVQFPYDEPVEVLRRRIEAAGLAMVSINCPPTNLSGGARGFAAIPGTSERFRHDFRRAIETAQALGAEHLHVMAGKAAGLVARQTFVENLRWAAREAPDQSLTIEPINGHDMPGYFLNDFDQAAAILDDVAAPNVGLQFDMYHAQMITGDGAMTWARHGRRAVHIQVARVPGRHEPQGGDVDFPAFFTDLDATGYGGWVSGEYQPEGDTLAGLGWMDAREGS